MELMDLRASWNNPIAVEVVSSVISSDSRSTHPDRPRIPWPLEASLFPRSPVCVGISREMTLNIVGCRMIFRIALVHMIQRLAASIGNAPTVMED